MAVCVHVGLDPDGLTRRSLNRKPAAVHLRSDTCDNDPPSKIGRVYHALFDRNRPMRFSRFRHCSKKHILAVAARNGSTPGPHRRDP